MQSLPFILFAALTAALNYYLGLKDISFALTFICAIFALTRIELNEILDPIKIISSISIFNAYQPTFLYEASHYCLITSIAIELAISAYFLLKGNLQLAISYAMLNLAILFPRLLEPYLIPLVILSFVLIYPKNLRPSTYFILTYASTIHLSILNIIILCIIAIFYRKF